MSKYYRFRSIDNLLGAHKELENQSIFFASPKQLNDPMEGFRNIFWHGDYIAWKNLFRHYLLCLEHVFSIFIIAGEDHHTLSANDIPIFSDGKSFPTEKYRDLFQQIVNNFLGGKKLETFLLNISASDRKVRRDELRFILQQIHLIALNSISEIYENNNLKPKREKQSFIPINFDKYLLKTNFYDLLKKTESEQIDGKNIDDQLFLINTLINRQLELLFRYNNKIDSSTKNKNFLLIEFPEEYLRSIENLIYPNWYTACFMSECRNSAIWAHYGDNHSGVCLLFEAEESNGKSFLPLNGIVGASSTGAIMGIKKMEFYPIDYTKGYGDIDFFRSLGTISMPDLESMWFKDLAGNISTCAEEIFTNESDWRNKYWSHFFRDITRKTDDWNYEKEYRLILSGNLIDYSNPEKRILKYDFSSLKGLIFGINTKTNTKLEIIKIIEKKCSLNGRKDFKFYQAYYSLTDKCIMHTEMNLLQFN